MLELTYNHDGRTYELGTAYGHIARGVSDLDATLAALKDAHGIEPERPPYQVSEGGSLICFVRDPDRYVKKVDVHEQGGYVVRFAQTLSWHLELELLASSR